MLLRVWMFALLLLLLAGCAPAPQGQPEPLPTLEPSPTVLLPTALPTLDEKAVAGKREIGGVVLSGGDQTPKDLLDAPRVFAYQVQTGDGEAVTVTYTAYPPSPAGDRSQIELDFHAGQVQVGDYLVAYGTFHPDQATITVADEGDFIRTYLEKP